MKALTSTVANEVHRIDHDLPKHLKQA